MDLPSLPLPDYLGRWAPPGIVGSLAMSCLYQEKSWALYGGVRWPAAGGCWWSWPVAGLGRLSGSSFLYDRAMQGHVGN